MVDKVTLDKFTQRFTDMWLPTPIQLESDKPRQQYSRKKRCYPSERQLDEKLVASRRKKAKLAQKARRKGRK